MDTDPLQDAPPARYAVESDSEDEIGHSPGSRPDRAAPTYKLVSNLPQGDHGPLMIICGPIARYWLSGFEGQTIGSIQLDETLVVEYWRTNTKRLVAVLTHRLPLGAQHLVAQSILETRGDSEQIIVAKTIELFAPPNLVQHLAAAIVAECEYLQFPITLLLIPTRHITPPAPSRPIEYSSADDVPPNTITLEAATRAVASVSQASLDQLDWKSHRVGQRSTIFKAQSRAKHLDRGEGTTNSP
ncbi:hypothetical protein RhiXN_10402 [Rhizoctonia solani]|uniref:Uncharacterized protein n=1 Tax=Rhizoctonia solani TaxID=456999 RepID=A0A8H8P3P1_9AGAM|nr:uncharacterized protein RhiXN_10402 [Rhizoctonia solani]QRW24078.1 hypothetical protein RhiXN_10402 [Rhizoctonia solani]